MSCTRTSCSRGARTNYEMHSLDHCGSSLNIQNNDRLPNPSRIFHSRCVAGHALISDHSARIWLHKNDHDTIPEYNHGPRASLRAKGSEKGTVLRWTSNDVEGYSAFRKDRPGRPAGVPDFQEMKTDIF